jgi:hypothetical protein
MTLRADLIETIAREVWLGRLTANTTEIAGWLSRDPRAAAVAGRHGMTRDEMEDAVDEMDYLRFVAAVKRKAAAM